MGGVTGKKGWIKVRAYEDPTGYIVMQPVNRKLVERIVEYLAEWKVESDGTVLAQSEQQQADALVLMPPRKQVEIRDGWTVTFKVEPWEFLHWYGWDAHEGVRL